MNRRRFLQGMGQATLAVAAAELTAPVEAQARAMTLAAAGDCLITRQLSRDANFSPLRDLLRSADVAFANFEMTLPDPEDPPAPTGGCGDLNNSAEGPMAEEMKWAGFGLVSTANNHALDYLAPGMFATLRKLDQAGLAHAGTGATLAQAGAPAYYDSPKGRAALIACASTIRPWSLAADGNNEIAGRPGLNPLRFRTTYRVPADDLEHLQAMARRLFPHPQPGLVPQTQSDAFNFLGSRFVAGSPADVLTEPEERDLARITASVRRAARNADLVIVSIHAHEGDRDREVPARFLPVFAHACLDAGAHAFLGHGPHVLRGMEIYKGRPIFYSLGNFIFQAESMRQVPQEIFQNCGLAGADPSDFFDRAMKGFSAPAFWEAVVPVAGFQDGRLTSLKLHPITLQPELSRAQRGTPVPAAETGKAIIERLARLSSPYGTKISWRDGLGVVEL